MKIFKFKSTVASIIIILISLSGCKKEKVKISPQSFSLDVNATVMSASRNVVLENVTVTITKNSSNWGGGYTRKGTAITDSNGKFGFKGLGASGSMLRVNADPGFREELSTEHIRFNPSEFEVMNDTIYLFDYVHLNVNSTTDTPLGPDDELRISVPGQGCKCESTWTGRAKANRFNVVSWRVIRDGVITDKEANVYCPVGQHTNYTIEY